jgi:capsular polysaccharide biosynthesis protein
MVKHSFDLKDGRVKLFLTRRKGEVLRCIKNAEDLESKLLSNGILVLDGSEPIEDVIDLFSRASHISGYHGSLFANTIYSPSDCKVYEFCSNKRVDYSFMIKFKFINDYIVDLIDADEQHDVALNIDELMSFYSQV